MNETTTHLVTLTVLHCGKCGITFGVPEPWRSARSEDHKTFWCPNGCSRWFPPGMSATEKLTRKLANTEESLRIAQADAKTAESRRRAEKAAKTKLKRRIASGVCPCCNRSFENLARHMAGQHPDFGVEPS